MLMKRKKKQAWPTLKMYQRAWDAEPDRREKHGIPSDEEIARRHKEFDEKYPDLPLKKGSTYSDDERDFALAAHKYFIVDYELIGRKMGRPAGEVYHNIKRYWCHDCIAKRCVCGCRGRMPWKSKERKKGGKSGRVRRFYTDDDKALIAEMFHEGRSDVEIAKKLSKRIKPAIKPKHIYQIRKRMDLVEGKATPQDSTNVSVALGEVHGKLIELTKQVEALKDKVA